jgi:hypothetical protein
MHVVLLYGSMGWRMWVGVSIENDLSLPPPLPSPPSLLLWQRPDQQKQQTKLKWFSASMELGQKHWLS